MDKKNEKKMVKITERLENLTKINEKFKNVVNSKRKSEKGMIL